MKYMFTIILFYKYTPIKNPKKLREEQKKICEKLQLKGRMIIAKEGINATLEGETSKIEKYIAAQKRIKAFSDIHFKKSEGTGNAFPRLSVKVRGEIVSSHLGEKDISPIKVTGKYITAEHFINCKDSFCDRHFICCKSCLSGREKILCPMGCRDYSREHPETNSKSLLRRTTTLPESDSGPIKILMNFQGKQAKMTD